MDIDVNNPVVKLCATAIQAEMSGNTAEAVWLSTRAWDSRRTDYDGCIAAHYLARYQDTAADRLLWNQKALDFALTVADSSVTAFLPSLYLNLGKSHEDLGYNTAAKRYYDLASRGLGVVTEGPYKDILAGGIAEALKRIEDRPGRG